MNPKRESARINCGELRLEPLAPIALLADKPPSDWPQIFQDLHALPALQDRFLREPSRFNFDGYSSALLRIAFGLELAARFEREIADCLLKFGPPPAWTTEPWRREGFRERVIYEAYVDLFAGGFDALVFRLPYLKDLGIDTLWIPPFLASPRDDAGYDQSDRFQVDARYGGNLAWKRFVDAARRIGIMIVHESVINHRSSESLAFQASSNPSHPEHDRYRDYFIWVPGEQGTRPDLYRSADCMFDGMKPPAVRDDNIRHPLINGLISGPFSWHAQRGQHFLHTFLPTQPDVNVYHPEVLGDELRFLVNWIDPGNILDVRQDAISHLFKRCGKQVHPAVQEAFGLDVNVAALVDSYRSRDLPHVQLVGVRLISAFLLHRYGGRVGLLTEANCSPEKWMRFFNGGCGTRLNYRFGRMQGLWSSLATGERSPLLRALLPDPEVPEGCAGVFFARVHDETTSERAEADCIRKGMSELSDAVASVEPSVEAQREAKDQIIGLLEFLRSKGENVDPQRPHAFCGRGIAARMRTHLEALPRNPDLSPDADLLAKHTLLMGVLMSLNDIPLIYMGDEWAEPDDWRRLHEIYESTGGLDMRNLHRSIADQDLPFRLLVPGDSSEHRLHAATKRAIAARNANPVMQHGTLTVLSGIDGDDGVLTFLRKYGDERVLVAANFAPYPRTTALRLTDAPHSGAATDLLTGESVAFGQSAISLSPRQILWLRI